jgi:hypothetical protein
MLGRGAIDFYGGGLAPERGGPERLLSVSVLLLPPISVA